jgi:hypothetical protein
MLRNGCITSDFSETFKEELPPLVLELFHKIEREGTLPKSVHEFCITLTQNLIMT